jgi:asparagine synthase (glutamine-hydrolysing)
MCGLAGVLEFGSQPRRPRGVLELMGQALAHRGPDERGTWTDGCIGLTARRLRIVDLLTGQQPLANEDGSCHLVANGEIYNADELRDELRRRDHVFASRTDTEVILHAYEDEGPACLDRLEGMFAFALWDSRQHQPFLALDRFGEKPLYYTRQPQSFLFASELKQSARRPHYPVVYTLLDASPQRVEWNAAGHDIAPPDLHFRTN